MAGELYREQRRPLHELGYCSADEVAGFANMLAQVEPGTRMMTPVVAEIVAIKR